MKIFLNVNIFILLLVGLVSFLRFTSVTNLFVPRKVIKVFFSRSALGDLAFSLEANLNEVIAIDSRYGDLETLRFLMYPKEVVLFTLDINENVKTVILKERRDIPNFSLETDNNEYKVYKRR